MRRVKHSLRASTLAETLVMMIVAGIVFLAAMEALTLLGRLAARHTAVIVETRQQSEGIHLLGQLLATADSIGGGQDTHDDMILLYHAGRQRELVVRDSSVLLTAGAFCDTLLRGVGGMRLMQYAAEADTVEIGTCRHTLKFHVRRPARELYETDIMKIENGYGYEEERP